MNIPVPFDVPPRSELWRRIRVAESILAHRALLPRSTVEELLRVLRGGDVAGGEPREVG